MEGVGSPPEQLSESLFTPLVISMAGLVSASLAIVSLQQFIVRYCLKGLLRSSTNIISGSEPISDLQFTNGVEEKILITIPILPYSTKDDRQNAFRVDQTECAICLGELEDGEMVRLLPNCRHAFHVECIDNWFLEHTSCPICRSPLVEPISTFDVTLPMAADIRNEDGVQDLTLVHIQNSVSLNSTSTFDVSASSSRVEPSGLLIRHSVSSTLPMEGKQQCLSTALKRSISMDQYFVLVNIQSESSKEESSLSRNVLVKSRSNRARSLSSKSVRSLSELRRSRSTTNGILPY